MTLTVASFLLIGCAASAIYTPVRVGSPEPDAGQDLDQPPTPVTLQIPNYPEFAKDAGIQGTVVLHVLVNHTGRPLEVRAIHSITGLDAAAINAAGKSLFEPASKDGRPVSAWVTIPYEFRL